MHTRHAARTDVGRVREHNEDSHLVEPELRLYVVADGMGGRAAGEIASRLAVGAVKEHVLAGRELIDGYAAGTEPPSALARLLGEAVLAAARAVFDASLAEDGRRGMGTTLSALLFSGDRAFVAHVGDSRVYLVRSGSATQLTRDHSLVDELVLAGHLTRDEAESPELERLRCVLARAVGVATDVAVDVLDLEVLPGDQFLLCSDGLTHYVDEDEIAAQLSGGLEPAVKRFVSLACDRGGHDNITAVAVRCESGDAADIARLRTYERKANRLAAVPLLHGLDAREFLHVLLVAETVDAPPGTVLLREDQPIPALFVLLEGRVRLARAGEPGEDLGPGRWFGDAALVDRWVAAPTALAVEPSRLVRLTRDALVAVSRREPEIAPKVVAAFAKTAAAAAAQRVRR